MMNEFEQHMINGMIAANASVNQAKIDETSPLHIASKNGYFVTVFYLIAAGVDVNKEDSHGFTPLYYASENGHTSIVAVLIAAHADVNMSKTNKFPLHFTTTTNGWTPLHIACFNGHDNIVTQLIAAGADVNKVINGNAPPLYIASEKGHDAIVTQLIAAGADVNLAPTHRMAMQTTLLIIACWNNHATVVSKLIAANADINKTMTDGSKAIHWATTESVEIMRMLIQAGTDVEEQTFNGDRPLNIACNMGHVEAVAFLVNECGVDRNVVDKAGYNIREQIAKSVTDSVYVNNAKAQAQAQAKAQAQARMFAILNAADAHERDHENFVFISKISMKMSASTS